MITEHDVSRVQSPGAENPKDRIGATKPPLHLIPPAAEITESLALDHGAKKYGQFNWRHTKIKASIYIAAARRHLCQWFDGEDEDLESGVSHLAHARACLGILLDALSLDQMIDDRPGTGTATELIEKFTQSRQREGHESKSH